MIIISQWSIIHEQGVREVSAQEKSDGGCYELNQSRLVGNKQISLSEATDRRQVPVQQT
jgi:hypothetical protein